MLKLKPRPKKYSPGSAIAATHQVTKAIKYLNVELPSTKKLNLTYPRFNSSLAPRGRNPNSNVHHKETNVYPNPNLMSSYILTQTLTLTSIICLYPNPNSNVQHKETSDQQNKSVFLYLSR